MSDVHLLFTVVSNDANAALGGTVLLDNIRFEPVPLAQTQAISFPQANKVFGVRPVANIQPGRVAIPPDQVIANLTTIYEASLASLALLSRGNPQDLESARVIADAFVYALSHDNDGLPIPTVNSNAKGLHNGMFSGDLPLYNDQGPGAGKAGQVRLSGFSITSSLCGDSHFCLVLDGATGGNNAFAMISLGESYRRFLDVRYLDASRTIGNWIYLNLLDSTGTGFGGYFLGYPDEGQKKVLITGKSIENNADIFRAMVLLSEITAQLGLQQESAEWLRRAKIAGDYVMQLFDPATGRFGAGTVPFGTPESPGIVPTGTRKGNEVINTYDFLDATTFILLPMAGHPLYRNAIDWRRPVKWIVDHFQQTVISGGQQYQGFSLVAFPTAGPTGIAWEFHGQTIVAMRFVDALYGEHQYDAQVQFYLDQMRKAQQSSPFTDGLGLVAATMQNGESLPPYEQCLSTPFQCIAARTGLAATTWAVFADLNVTPFDPFPAQPPQPPAPPINPSPVNGATAVSTSPTLTWAGGSGATSYDFYFGASSSPPFLANTTASNYSPGVLASGVTYYWRVVAKNSAGPSTSATWSFTTSLSGGSSGLRFVPVAPCRVVDTRLAPGPFGGPSIAGGTTRNMAIPSSSCGIPSNAAAYSLNVTVVPSGVLSFLTLWPTGQSQPGVSTLNSFDGRIKANAAIVPAGTGGQVSVFVTHTTDAILDINGYFVPASGSTNLAFYPVTPCRITDTRNSVGPFGGPSMTGGQTRSFAIPNSACGVPTSAQAYALNMTVVPAGPLAFLTTWPTGQAQPAVSTLNAFTGTVTANAAIVPAGSGGGVSAFVTHPTDLIIDIIGFFAPPGSPGALSFYPVNPCRIADTRNSAGPFGGPAMAAGQARKFPVTSSGCGLPTAAKAYSINATAVPSGPLAFLTLWQAGQPQPSVSTLNAFDGSVVSNAAIVPAGTDGSVTGFVTNLTNLILDANGHFAP